MDVTANLVTVTQMQTWMQAAKKRTTATADEWCYALNHLVSGACKSLPISVLVCCGMKANQSNRSTLPFIPAQQFLDCLRQYQLGINASTQGPGAHTGEPPPPPSQTPGSGAGGTISAPPVQAPGVLGPTSCPTCQQLASNPVLLLVLAVAAYFFLFK